MTLIIVGIILLVTNIFFFNKIKRIIESVKDRLQIDISDIKKYSNRAVNFGINYEMVVVNTDNQNIIFTSEHAFVPIIPEIGQIMSFHTPDEGYVETTIVSTNHYQSPNNPTFIFVYIKDVHPTEMPFNLNAIEKFKKNNPIN